MRHTNTFAALALVFSGFALAAGFAPAQLRDFPQDQLVLQHADTRVSLQIWLADTDARQSQGLMFLTELPQGYGMLFPLTEPRVMNMWSGLQLGQTLPPSPSSAYESALSFRVTERIYNPV